MRLHPANPVLTISTSAGQAYDHPPADFHCDSFSYSMIKRLSHWKAIG